MLLLVDCGNTRIKWAIAAGGSLPGQWLASGSLEHAAPDALRDQAQAHGVQRAMVSNVAGDALAARLATLLPADTTWFRAQAELKGLRNRYRDPGQLGADRFAAALGARSLEPGRRLLVATCGTATTVDALAGDEFLGGMIVPGLGLMAASLARNTAQLPLVAPGRLPPVFADNTDDAILSGILSAQAGAIERAFAQHRADLCVLSGGAAAYIAPALSVPLRMVDNIVLVGLHAAAT